VASESRFSVVSAIVGNALVMTAKFTAFAFTGSGAMFSEAVHTAADVLNQLLLFVGIVRSGRAPDRRYPYGYGPERFVWALISAVGIFFLGCGVTIYHGVHQLMAPRPVHDYGWAIAVLLISLVIEGTVLVIAARGLHRAAEGRPFWSYVRTEADPSAVAVLLEDSAACLGVLIALGCILLSERTGDPRWDAAGSLLIGTLLGLIATWLVRRNRELLVGRAIPVDTEETIRQVLLRHREVDRVIEIRGKVIDTETYDVAIEVDFDGARFAELLEADLKEAWRVIEGWEDFRAFAVRYADQVLDLVGDKIDEIEAQVAEAVPRAKHIDVEPD